MEYDDLELDTLGEQKTALFVIISDTDATFNFVVSIMYSQLFNLLCDKADDVYNGRLPIHVRMLLDEFANIGQIPQFEKLIATIRSREISASIILQSKSQLKAIYKDNADTIEGNCDTTLFLGGKEKTTLKELEDVLGKETIVRPLGIIKTEYSIPVDEKLRKDMSAMCNLSQGIRENATDNAITGVIMNMHRDGYSSEQIARIVEKTIEEVEAVIRKREPVLA